MVRTMVLGLLKKHGSMSGYEIQMLMESGETETWAYVQPPSIYHALKKMSEEGLIGLASVEQTGYRTKALYAITPKGEEVFEDMLRKAFEKTSVVFPATLYTALTFWDDMPISEAITAVEKQIETIKQTIFIMDAGKARKAEITGIPENVQLIYQNIYAQCELQLDYMEKVKSFLESRA